MALRLVTGADVGALWIELQDAEGWLVRWTHLRAKVARFVKGHAVVRHNFQASLSYLLAAPLGSDNLGESYIRVAMRHAILSSSTNLTIEDQFT